MALAHVISERGTEGDEERQKKVAQLIKNIRSDEAEKEQAKDEQSKNKTDDEAYSRLLKRLPFQV